MDLFYQSNRTKLAIFCLCLYIGMTAVLCLSNLAIAAEEEKAGRVFFSPNGDGIIDAAIFRLSVSNPTNVASWEFIILDNQGREVKRLSGTGAPPNLLEWNGRDEHNQLISDGTYQYALNVVTLAGNHVNMSPQELICDRQTPSAKVSVEPTIFSAEEGSAKPTARFYIEALDANSIHSWLLKIQNVITGVAMKSFYGKGQPPASTEWSGQTDGDDPAPDGDYQFTLAVRDRAGNTTTTEPQKVTIDRAEPITVVEAKPSIFSPNNDGVQDLTIFSIQIPTTKKVIEQWILSILNPKGKVVKTFEGRGELPREIAWDGKEKAGQTVEDSAYSYQLVMVDQAGNRGTTIQKTLIVDNTPPKAVVDLKPVLLSPNGDGFGDNGLFQIDVVEINGIQTYGLEIRNDVGDIKRVFKGEGTPQTRLQWAGQEEGNRILIDGKYSYSMILIDNAGNKTVTSPKPFQIDTSPPVVNMTVEPKLISPNGEQKEAILQILVQDASEIEAWTLKIEDNKKKLVRKFEGTGLLLKPLAWDGRMENKEMVPDGPYNCIFWVQDKAHNDTLVPPQSVIVGAKIPDVVVQAKLPCFSPNADDIKDNNTFSISVQSFNKIRHWAVEIADTSGMLIRKFEGLASVPREIIWGGERDDKSPADDGIYRYILKVIDEAGNKNETAPQMVQIDTTRPQIDVKAVPPLFSPNNDGFLDQSLFNLTYRDASPANQWTVTIKNEKNKESRLLSGQNSVPENVAWDGKGEANKTLPDGPYTYTMNADDIVGNKSSTLEQIARLDTTPPELTLSVEPDIFAPRSNSLKNRALFIMSYQDASNISQWSLRFNTAKGGEVYQIKGEGSPPAEIVWEGANEKNVIFPDDLYKVQLVARDEVGNEGKSPEVKVTIDTSKPLLAVAAEEELVPSLMPELHTQESPRGIVINLAAEVLFETAKAELRPVAYPTLDEVAALFKKYAKRHILIEGHTDNVPINTAEFPSNQELSESRAKSIVQYFVDMRKVDATRFTFKGYADTRPVAENTTPQGRQKNRRVEVVILKSQENTETPKTIEKNPK